MENKKSKRDVAAGIITCGGLILIAQRKHGKSQEYKWEFPGGKLEKGETLQECLKRELKEEMDLDITVEEHFADSTYDYDFGTIVLHVFKASCNHKDISVLPDHEQYKWVKAEALADYDFAPADRPVVAEVLAEVKNNPSAF